MYNKEIKKYGWPLDYTWATRFKWNETSDVLLEGKITNSDNTLYILNKISSNFEYNLLLVDNRRRKVFYEGGIYFYFEKNIKGHSIFLHSSGQDAFDTICYYSQYFEEQITQRISKIKIKWIEHKHNRKTHLLTYL